MKKGFFIMLFLLSATGAMAQFNGGLKAGMNISNFAGDDADGFDPLVGFHIGGYVTFDISDKVLIQPELVYNTVGAKASEKGTDPDLGDYSVDLTQKLNYLSVPVMFMYKVNDNFNLQAGPQLGFLVGAKAEFDIKSDFIDTSGSTDNKEDYLSTDFSFNLGFGAEFGKVNLAARYCIGLSNVADGGDIDVDVKNNAFQISVGYKAFNK
jgi:hypothetical protein